MMLRIDSHQHFWRLSRGDYGWLKPDEAALRPLSRDFEPEHLAPLMAQYGVDNTVAVQAAPSVAETEHLLELAGQHPWIAGVVGWVDLSAPTAAEILWQFARHATFRGVRPMLQDLPDPEWIATAPRDDAMAQMVMHDLCFDALVRAEHLGALDRFVARHPNLRVVIDHAAKPALHGETIDPAWVEGMTALARHPQVMCKLSGLLTELNAPADTPVDALALSLQPVWRHLLACFGPERLIWGSDWPVLNLAADYGRWIDVTQRLLDPLPAAQQAAIWAGNAESTYRLSPVLA